MEDQTTQIYAGVGSDQPFYDLVEAFYQGVEKDSLLRPLYPDDLTHAKQHLAWFLIQRFGGPARYGQERGHPRLRMRHLPFQIGPRESAAWLAHMTAAIDAVPEFAPYREILDRYFAESAAFLSITRKFRPLRSQFDCNFCCILAYPTSWHDLCRIKSYLEPSKKYEGSKHESSSCACFDFDRAGGSADGGGAGRARLPDRSAGLVYQPACRLGPAAHRAGDDGPGRASASRPAFSHLRPRHVVRYIQNNLVLKRITTARRYQVYCIARDGHEYLINSRLAVGTPVFVLRGTDTPILKLACGNPMVRSALPEVLPYQQHLGTPKLASLPTTGTGTLTPSLKPNGPVVLTMVPSPDVPVAAPVSPFFGALPVHGGGGSGLGYLLGAPNPVWHPASRRRQRQHEQHGYRQHGPLPATIPVGRQYTSGTDWKQQPRH